MEIKNILFRIIGTIAYSNKFEYADSKHKVTIINKNINSE